MKKISPFFAAVLCTVSISSFAGNKIQVIIPGEHGPTSFKMPANLKPDDYLPNTIIFKVKAQYRQNCKVNSVDNLLPLEDFLQNVNAQGLAKIFPRHNAPERTTNVFGQKLIDLSTIYSFKYNSAMPLEKVISGLLSLGYFEYAEPWYVPKPDVVCTPNDPSLSGQYHLQGNVVGSIDVLNTAWCTTNGDSTVVIGIVDTGTQLDHPDLAANIAHNWADPINGLDDDNDGYVDNFNGWDLGMNDNDPSWQGNPHGVMTSGDACAVTNNNTGVSSPGFNCHFLPVKGADAAGSLVAVYPGIVYAADHGAKIISNSWGGSGGGAYGQDIISYAAINKNCLVLGSAGNTGTDSIMYPSSFDNIYRVSASTNQDKMSGFSTFGNNVDFCAPGTNVYSTTNGSGYGQSSGTSMACPVAAGAAGLIQAKFNYTNAFQIGEKLKQTCDTLNNEAKFKAGKLGKGRIDVNNALTQAAKSLAMNSVTITDGNDNIFLPGEALSISGIVTNYLDPSSSSATAVLSIVGGGTYATVTSGNFAVGALTTLGTNNNTASPYSVNISPAAPINQLIQFMVTITDGAFTSKQYFDVTVNVDYINITVNDVYTTITSKGRVGYNQDGQAQGLGFEYQLPSPQPLLYEMSLMIGTSATQVSDMFRDVSTNNDFASTTRVLEIPAVGCDFEAEGNFNDAPSSSGPIPVDVHHSAYAWATSPYRKFVIVKYIIKNTSAATLSNLYAGIVADWDVPNANSGQDKSGFDTTNKMGYVYYVGGPGPYAAIKLLSNTAPVNNYFIDLISGGNGGVDASTDFLTAEKYTTLSTPRNADGYPATGGDIMDCVSSGPFTINAGDSVEVAFALIAGDDLTDIQASAAGAQIKYDLGLGINEPANDNFWAYNFPNPAANTVNINYNVNGYKNASLRIINLFGEVVMTLNNLATGRNTVSVDVSKLSSGTYFYELKADDAALTKKLIIIK